MDFDKDELLEKLKDTLKDEVSVISYETWILPLGIKNIQDNHINFIVSSDFQKDFIENKFSSLILNALKYITNKEWTFSVIDSQNDNEKEEVIDLELENNRQTLNPKFTFETFVVGSNNRLANAAA